MIKKTRNPIICICNDAHSQKVTRRCSCFALMESMNDPLFKEFLLSCPFFVPLNLICVKTA